MMANLRKSKVRIALPKLDGPPTPTKVDLEIVRNNGSPMAIETAPERLQASKYTPTPSQTDSLTSQGPNPLMLVGHPNHIIRLGQFTEISVTPK